MSDYRAIAGVSRTLKTLLRDRMQDPVSVSFTPPDVTKPDDISGKWLNLYLYQVFENGYLKNQEIPGQGHPSAYGHPPLSLDLYYLLTAHASIETLPESDLDAQEILGDAMRVLHDYSMVTDQLPIRRATVGTVGEPILDLHLRDEFEQIKITLQPMSLEDLSKIWTAMPEANFRRSVAYQVSVVQIESRRPRRYPQPVRELPSAGPRVHVMPFRSPQIREIRVIRQDDPDRKERPFPYARIDDILVIRGRNLAGEATRVILGTVDATAEITVLRDDRIEVTIPNDEGLQPGSQTVKVVLDVMMGEPPQPHLGFQSNLAVFVLVPHIKGLDITTTPGTLIVEGTRLFKEGLDCLTLVGDEVIPSDDYTAKTSTGIAFSIPTSLGSGDHAIRVRVNGAESIDLMRLTIP